MHYFRQSKPAQKYSGTYLMCDIILSTEVRQTSPYSIKHVRFECLSVKISEHFMVEILHACTGLTIIIQNDKRDLLLSMETR